MVEEQNGQGKSWEDIERELNELNKKCFKDDPEDADLEALREYLNQNMHAYSFLYELEKVVEKKIMGEFSSNPAIEIYTEVSTWQMRVEMGYENAPTIERMLVDNIINCWLRLLFVELSPPQHRTYKHDIRDNQLTTAQRRFRQAILTYTRVKKLISQTPALQFNIATGKDQEVYVNGDEGKSSKGKQK